jgi:polyisoprenoid-binding protein YceI
MTSNANTRAAAVAVPAPGTYEVDPRQSAISFTTRHMFGLGGVTGSFAVSTGRIVVADPPRMSSVTATASATSFTTGNAGRDKKVRSKTFLDAGTFPEISLRSTKIRENNGTWVLTATLTVRGEQAPAEFTVTEATTSEGLLTLKATSRVDRYHHGVTAMKGMAGQHLDIELTVVANRTTGD